MTSQECGHPPIQPPQHSRQELLNSISDLEATDNHALEAPPGVEVSVETLVEYLTRPAQNDTEKVRAFYRWITDRITFQERSPHRDAVDVLNHLNTQCEGFTELFYVLCCAAGIPCKKISGFGKGKSEIEGGFTHSCKPDHAWNIVHVGGQWCFVDVTWGAGKINQDGDFLKCFEEIYFLTNPQDFIIRHFPCVHRKPEDNKVYQLLRTPLTIQEFNEVLNVESKGIAWGFEASHQHNDIIVNGQCSINFRTRHVDLQRVSCCMTRCNPNIDCNRYVLLRGTGVQEFKVTVTPPRSGQYFLKVYGSVDASRGPCNVLLVSYVIHCISVIGAVRPYSNRSGEWGVRQDAEEYGFTTDIFSNRFLSTSDGGATIRIKTTRDFCSDVRLENQASETIENSYMFADSDGYLIIKAFLPQKGLYKLSVYSEHPDVMRFQSLHHVVDFFIRRTDSSSDRICKYGPRYKII